MSIAQSVAHRAQTFYYSLAATKNLLEYRLGVLLWREVQA
jgi:hypothetical protein